LFEAGGPWKHKEQFKTRPSSKHIPSWKAARQIAWQAQQSIQPDAWLKNILSTINPVQRLVLTTQG